MTYLEELLAGYQQGLAGKPLRPIQALQAALAETHDARQRGRLLGLIAQRLAERANNHVSSVPARAYLGSPLPKKPILPAIIGRQRPVPASAPEGAPAAPEVGCAAQRAGPPTIRTGTDNRRTL